MILKQKIYKLINTNEIRLRLALELGVSENTIRNYINDKSDNLTKAAALNVIKEFTGLTDSEILESEAKATA